MTADPADPERDLARRWAVGLVGAALLLRLAHLWTLRDSPFFNVLYIDPRMYDAWGVRIAGGTLLSPAPFFLDPLYPYFIGAIYAMAGRSYFAVAFVQSLLGATVPLLVWDAARASLGPRVARLAGAIAVVYPLSIYYGGVLLKPGLASCAVALTLWLLSRALAERPRPGPRRWISAGVALGLAVLLRGHLLFVVPVVAVWAAWAGRWSRGLAPLALIGGTLLVLAPPLAHNLAVSGEWIVPTTNWGQFFYIGNNPRNAEGRFDELPFVRSDPAFEQEDFKREAERRAGRSLTYIGTSRLWLAAGLDWIAAHPRDALAVSWSKLRIFWGAYETPASQDYYLYRRYAPLLRLPWPAFGLLGPLGLVGAVLAWSRGPWPRLLAVWIVAATLAVVPFFVLTRFRMIVVPALFPLAALALVELWDRGRAVARREAHWRAAAVPVGGLLLAFAFVDLPVRKPADTWSYRVAAALGFPTRLETTALGRYNLGVSYARLADGSDAADELLGHAESWLRGALDEAPDHTTWVELGKVLARRGRDDEALAAYGRAVALQPQDWRSLHARGLLYERTGRPAAAAAEFEQALRLAPGHAPSAVRLGHAWLAAGNPAAAAEAYRHALRLRPGDARAREGLARAEGRTGP